jgi:DnaJ-class molecular chaperone
MKLTKTASGKKIKISKKEWKSIGKKTGWLKTVADTDQKSNPKKECPRCHGDKFLDVKLKNLSTLEWVDHIIACPTCNGKGYITKEDSDSYYHSMGIAPCPHGN